MKNDVGNRDGVAFDSGYRGIKLHDAPDICFSWKSRSGMNCPAARHSEIRAPRIDRCHGPMAEVCGKKLNQISYFIMTGRTPLPPTAALLSHKHEYDLCGHRRRHLSIQMERQAVSQWLPWLKVRPSFSAGP